MPNMPRVFTDKLRENLTTTLEKSMAAFQISSPEEAREDAELLMPCIERVFLHMAWDAGKKPEPPVHDPEGGGTLVREVA